MRRLDASVSMIAFACVILLFVRGGHSLAIAESYSHLTAEQATAAARRYANPESSLTILWTIIANADTRRTADQAVEQVKAHKLEAYENGRLVNMLWSGGYLLAETDPRTNNVVAMHLVSMESEGNVKDVASKCHGVLKIAEARELVKDTAELVKQMYSTPSTEASSLASRFYDGKFPNAHRYPDSLFTIPDSLRKPDAKSNEVQEASALFWGYLFWPSRSALSIPAFSANPAAAITSAEKERDMLKAEFLQSNKLDPNLDPTDFNKVQSGKQLLERIDLLRRLNRFLEDSLSRKADPAAVGANLLVLTMPLSVDVDLNQAGQYVSSSPPKSLFLWHRVASDGFAIEEITWDW